MQLAYRNANYINNKIEDELVKVLTYQNPRARQHLYTLHLGFGAQYFSLPSPKREYFNGNENFIEKKLNHVKYSLNLATEGHTLRYGLHHFPRKKYQAKANNFQLTVSGLFNGLPFYELT